MKNQQNSSQIFSSLIILQVRTNRTKYVLNTNCPTLYVAPNMAKNTCNHGHMQKERQVLGLGKKNHMNGHTTLIPRCQDAKQEKHSPIILYT